MQETQATMFEIPREADQSTLSKKGFAELIGVSPGRVSQMITQGLPVDPHGRIDRSRGQQWVRANIDPNRRRAAIGGDHSSTDFATDGLTPRAARDLAEAKISHLKAERLEGRLLDRRATERVIEARAKMESAALIGWVNRVAPIVASETKSDLALIASILDREIRDHLISIAGMPVDLPK